MAAANDWQPGEREDSSVSWRYLYDGIPETSSDLVHRNTAAAILCAGDIDAYCTETLEDLAHVAYFSYRPVDTLLSSLAMLLIKPDAVVRYKVHPTLNWLEDRQWRVHYAAAIRINRWITRGLWGYAWRSASRSRRDIADLLMSQTDSLLLILTHPGAPDNAATRLVREKGTFDTRNSRAGTLRHDLGALNRQLNLVHSADTPTDVVRELGVCLDPQQRLQALEAAAHANDAGVTARQLATELEDGAVRGLSLGGCIDRVTQQVDLLQLAPDRRRKMLDVLEEVRGGSRDWRRILQVADEARLPLEAWDVVVLATHLMPRTRGES